MTFHTFTCISRLNKANVHAFTSHRPYQSMTACSCLDDTSSLSLHNDISWTINTAIYSLVVKYPYILVFFLSTTPGIPIYANTCIYMCFRTQQNTWTSFLRPNKIHVHVLIKVHVSHAVRSHLVSRAISEVKQPWASPVLGWETTREAHVLYSFLVVFWILQIEFPAKPIDYFLWSNKSNINQSRPNQCNQSLIWHNCLHDMTDSTENASQRKIPEKLSFSIWWISQKAESIFSVETVIFFVT